MDVYFVEWLWGYSCIHTQVCVSNVSWIIATRKTDHTTYTRGIVFRNINWNTVPMISRYQGAGGEDFQCVFDIMESTLNTQTSIFCTPLVLQSTYLKDALQSTGTFELYFYFCILLHSFSHRQSNENCFFSKSYRY